MQATTQQLFKAQPFLGAMAADPSLRGVMDSLSTVLLGVSAGQAKLSDVDARWRDLPTAWPRRPKAARNICLARADHRRATPAGGNSPLHRSAAAAGFRGAGTGAHASDTIRADARALGLTPDKGVTIRLTGDVPLSG